MFIKVKLGFRGRIKLEISRGKDGDAFIQVEIRFNKSSSTSYAVEADFKKFVSHLTAEIRQEYLLEGSNV